MLITVRETKGEVWKSPDGRVSIYEIVDQDGNQWSTKSHKIGKGLNQSFEVEVENKNGKTYLRLPVDPNAPYANRAPSPQQASFPPAQAQQPASAELSVQISKLMNEIQLLRSDLRQHFDTPTSVASQPDQAISPNEPKTEDYVISPEELAAMEKNTPEAIADFFGGEIVDDL